MHEPEDGAPLEAAIAERLEAALAGESASAPAGPGQLLLELAARYAGHALPPTWGWFRELASAYLERVRVVPEGAELPLLALDAAQSASLLAARPAIVGADHLDEVALFQLRNALDQRFRETLAEHRGSVQTLLESYDAGWHGVGRVVLNLAENKKDPDFPFAFMATYTTRLAAGGKAQHQPLGRALSEYAGKGNKAQLTALLVPLQRASAACEWLAEMLRTQEIFEPLKLAVAEAAEVLRDVPRLEQAGVTVRMPQQWGGQRPPRPKVQATVGATAPRGGEGRDSGVGGTALLDFQVSVTLDGEALSEDEIAALLAQTSGLALLRGRWVELDARQLAKAHERFEALARQADEGLTFNAAMRLLAGAETDGQALPRHDARVSSGPSLLIVPASLIGNWSQELTRFAPTLRLVIAHPSSMSAAALAALDGDRLAQHDVVITTYGTAAREASKWITALTWHHLIADEAQALKNPGTRVARRLKNLQARSRIAMTGTPIENRLGDLWSLFDFLKPGLLGSAAAFTAWMKGARGISGDASSAAKSPWGPLRELVKPYILRRKKTDKRIISDHLGSSRIISDHLGSSRVISDHLGSTRQDRARHLVPPLAAPGGALSGGGRRSRREARDQRGHPAARPRARVADALEADLQSPLAVARRWRLEPRRQRQIAAATRDRRDDPGDPGEGPGLHSVPRGE